MLGEQLLVRGDDALLRRESVEDELLRHARAAYRLDDDVDIGVGDDRRRFSREHPRRHRDAAVRRDVEICNRLEHDVDAEALRHDVAMPEKAVRDARPYGSKT